MNKISVIIVDDHAIVRNGITAMLSFYQNIDVIGAASSYEHLVSLLDSKTPDVIILDIEMPDKNGIEIAAILQKDYPSIKKIILSAHITPDTISDAIDAGVVSILPKDSNEDELYLAISKASKGENHYSHFVSDLILKNYLKKDKIEVDNKIEKVAQLSEREIEIIVAFGDGLSYKEIGEKLFISPRTVESHKNRILEKLELNTIIDLVKFGIKYDLIQI
ncbi:MAG: response regulator transcription factor [Bacteroidales bacterium]|nr:response regulator transcription factor [Bacteroidales bacterium]